MLAISNQSTSSYNTINLLEYLCQGISRQVFAFVGLDGIIKTATVSKYWCKQMDSQSLWKKLFDTYGIPRVIGEQRNYRADFKYLYPITISSHKIAKYFGRVVGSIPSITQEELDKFQGRNFRVVIVPSMIIRTIDQKKTPLALDEEGNIVSPPLILGDDSGFPIEPSFTLSDKTVKEGDLKIAFSLKNLMVLSNLKENENGPIFADNCWVEAVNQCDRVAPKNYVYLMEYNFAKESEGLPFEDQEALVKKEGFKVTPLMPRVLFDTVEILESGTFPDSNSETILFSDIVFQDDFNHAIIDTYYKKMMRIDYDSFRDGDDNVVVRGWPCGSSSNSK